MTYRILLESPRRDVADGGGLEAVGELTTRGFSEVLLLSGYE